MGNAAMSTYESHLMDDGTVFPPVTVFALASVFRSPPSSRSPSHRSVEFSNVRRIKFEVRKDGGFPGFSVTLRLRVQSWG